MFKTSSFGDEIYRSMEKKLASDQLENKYSFDKIAKAADYLNAAASLFDKAGMYSESAEITEVLRSLAKQLSTSSK